METSDYKAIHQDEAPHSGIHHMELKAPLGLHVGGTLFFIMSFLENSIHGVRRCTSSTSASFESDLG
jgi:hypothetical protein